jgi:hypothetical protein
MRWFMPPCAKCPHCGEELLKLRASSESDPEAWLYMGAEVCFSVALCLSLFHFYAWAGVVAALTLAVCAMLWRPAAKSAARRALYVCTRCPARYSFDELVARDGAT